MVRASKETEKVSVQATYHTSDPVSPEYNTRNWENRQL